MFQHTLDPVIFHLGPVEIRWYGLVYVVGFALVYWLLHRAVKEKSVKNLDQASLDELVFYLVLGVVIGSRLLLFIFTMPMTLISDPLELFRLWNGGMSFHGGLIGVGFAGWLFCRKHKVRFFALADLLAAPAALMLFFGRITNFVNAELIGTVTNAPWCVSYDGVEGCRHPSQLYEAIKNIAIFTALSMMGQQKKEGTTFWTFILLYGTLRFLVTFFRDDPHLLLGLSGGQALSFLMAIAAAYMLWGRRK